VGNLDTASHRLPVLVLASTLIHVVLLAAGPSRPLVAGHHTLQPDIAATLEAVRQRSTRAAGESKPNPVPETVDNTLADNSMTSGHAAADLTDQSPNTETSYQAAASAVQAGIGKQLNRYFHYPALARRRGWEGLVLLDFIIDDEGQLNDIRIRKSSGYELLDSAAMDALSKVQVHPVPARTLLAAINLERLSVPVIYKLVNR